MRAITQRWSRHHADNNVCRGSRYGGSSELHVLFRGFIRDQRGVFWPVVLVIPVLRITTPKQYAVALAPTLHSARPLPRLHCARAVAPPMRAYACAFPHRSGLPFHPAGVA